MNATLATVLALGRPVCTCLVAGGLKALVDYQANPRWTPALVDGGITALTVAGSMLTIGGAVSGVRTANARASARADTSAKPPA